MASIDMDQTGRATVPARPRWALVALALLVAGLVGGLVATVADAAATPAPAPREVRLEATGGGVVTYAAIARRGGGVEDVASVVPHQVAGPAVVVLTVRASTHSLTELAAGSGHPRGSCRIWVDGVLADEEWASGGATATCVATIDS